MTVTGQPSTSLLESVLKAGSVRQKIDVELLAKAQDVARQQGEAMVNMLERSAPPPIEGGSLDVYA